MERRRETEPVRRLGRELPIIILPPYHPPTAEELERRRALGERARAIRKRIGPLGFSVIDLIREDRDNN